MSRITVGIGWIAIIIILTLLAGCGRRSAGAAERQGADAPVCSDAIGCVTIGPDEPIKIAPFQSQTGPLAELGVEGERAIQLAAEEYGEIKGHAIELAAEDSGCTPENGTTGALRVVADPQILGAIGTTCSGAAETASKIVSDAGMVMISASNAAPALTFFAGERGEFSQPGYFRTSQNGQYSGAAAAHFAYESGIRKAATLNDGDPYSVGLTEVFALTFEELGGEIVVNTTVNKDDADMEPVLEAIAGAGAELLYFPIFRPAGDHILRQAKAMAGFEEVAFMSADGLNNDIYLAEMGEDAVGMYFVAASEPQGAAYEALTQRYTEQFGAPFTPYYGPYYDATMMLLHAIEAAAQQQDDGTLLVGRQAVRDYLLNLRDFEGTTGTITCDEYGDCAPGSIDVMQVIDPAAGVEGLRNNVVYSFTP